MARVKYYRRGERGKGIMELKFKITWDRKDITIEDIKRLVKCLNTTYTKVKIVKGAKDAQQ